MAARAPSSRLKEYAAKRNFSSTPEPRPITTPGRKAPAGRTARTKPAFCVQKHLASRLHYDLRLEHNGVLLSWAVPKGPSLNPADKRMAVRTEDHPLGYGDFEGVIPSGYGAGVVLLWDRGTWEPEVDDVDAALDKGELKFRLDGVKLKGSWVLVRTRRQPDSGGEQWLLIKHRDHWSGDVDVTALAGQSVKSFGDLADVLASSEEGQTLSAKPPVKSGPTAALYREVIAEAKERRANESNPSAKSRAGADGNGKSMKGEGKKPAPKPLPKSALVLGDKRPKLSNQAKVLYPATGFTKGGLVDYYVGAAPLILPHLRGRAVTLKRYPDGVDGKSFFEKRCPSHRPDWAQTVTVPSAHAGTIRYCLIEDVSTLMWVANLAAIELHVPLALAEEPERPTAMVFDLDPGPPASLQDAARVALRLRDLLDGVGLRCCAKTSGSKGLHLLVPLNTPDVTFDGSKSFARAVAMTLQKDDPERVIASMSRSAREGKVFIDWSQNDRAKTTVCAYSVRAKEKPWISTPLSWDRVEAGELDSLTADTNRMPARDLMADVLALKQKLPKG